MVHMSSYLQLGHLGLIFQLDAIQFSQFDMEAFDQVIQRQADAVWEGLDHCPRTCHQQVRLCTYQSWFARLKSGEGAYLKLPFSASDMRLVLRFRMGCHSLPIEVGRRTNVPRPLRSCQICPSGCVGDERHLLLECSALQGVREQHASLVGGCRDSMRVLLWHKDQMAVFKYVRDCLRAYQDLSSDPQSDDSQSDGTSNS